MSSRIKINRDRLKFLMDEYRVTETDLLGNWIYTRDRLKTGLLTFPQIEFLSRYFYVSTDFFLEDDPITREELYTPEQLAALDSYEDYPRYLKDRFMRAEICRQFVLNRSGGYWEIPEVRLEVLKSILDRETPLGFYELRDLLWDLGVLVFTGLSNTRDFFVPGRFCYGVLNFEKLPVILITKFKGVNEHQSSFALYKALEDLTKCRRRGILGIARDKRCLSNDTRGMGWRVSFRSNDKIYRDIFGKELGALRLIYAYGIKYCRLLVSMYIKNRVSYLEMKNVFSHGKDQRCLDNLIECRELLYLPPRYERKREGYYGRV